MANANAVAVTIELLGGNSKSQDLGNPIRFAVADGTAIPKGTLMKLTDPRTAIKTSGDNDPFCGILVEEKVASDGQEAIACYTKGIFDLEQKTGVTSSVGERVSIAGENIVSKCAAADLLFADVGIALEDAASEEIFAVRCRIWLVILMADSVGMQDLRAEEVDRIVKNFALEEFKMLPLCSIASTSAWKQTYYQETDSDLTGGTGSAVAGVPRLAAFPYGEVTWTETAARVLKHGMDAVISWEDAKTDAIDVMGRSLLRIARAIANSVDGVIITELATTTNTAAAVATWDAAVVADRDPVQDILAGIEGMALDNWDALSGDGFIVLHPTNYKELMMHEDVKNSSRFYSSDVTKKGKVERICGLRVIVANSSTEDVVLMGISKTAMTWYEASPLKTHVMEDPGVKFTVRAYQVGVPVLINNNAAWKITAA